MSILVDRGTRLLVQGMTGSEGTFHTEQMIAYGTTVVAGVSPGKGGTTHLGRPVFDTVQDAVAATGANTAAVFVPAPAAADAIMEAGAAGIGLVVAITEGVPILDAIRARAFLERRGVRLIGPNCPGLVSPGDQAKVGIIPNHICTPGPVGIVSRSGTLTYEIIQGLGRAGLGQSSSVGIGGDPVLGLSFAEVVALFAADPQTECVVLAGEIGGSDEERAAEVIAQGYPKPVVAFISGTTGTPASKVSALTAAGAVVADTIEEVVELVAARLRPTAAAGA